jgi:Type IV secretion system pilin
MRIMKKLLTFIWLLFLGATVVSPAGASFASAGVNLPAAQFASFPGAATAPTPSKATPKASPSPTTQTCAKDAKGNCSDLLRADSCVQVALPIVSGGSSCVNNSAAQGGAIIIYLREVLQLMSSAVGIVIVLMLVVAGIQYITSTGNPSLVGAAKKRIMNALTALFLFMFMVLILQFIVPGGIL